MRNDKNEVLKEYTQPLFPNNSFIELFERSGVQMFDTLLIVGF